MRKFLILACLTAPAAPALADDPFYRPTTCELRATAQHDICEVESLYVCGQGVGAVLRTESFDANGLYAVSIDDPAKKVYRNDFIWSDGSFWMQYSGDEPIDVIRKGSGASTFVGEFQAFGLSRPVTASSTTTYAGETVNLAGTMFQRLESKLVMQLPYPVPAIKGREVIAYNEELQISVTLESEHDEIGSERTSSKLAELSLDGQAGFGDETPRFGCDQISWIYQSDGPEESM